MDKMFSLVVTVPHLDFYETVSNQVYIAPQTGTPGGAGTKSDPLDLLPTTKVANTEYVLKGGEVYYDQIDIAQSGASGQKIILDGNSRGDFGTGKAIVEPTVVVTGWFSDGTINGHSVFTAPAPTGSTAEAYTILQGGVRTRLAQDVGANDMYEVHDLSAFHVGTGSETNLEANRKITSPVFAALSSTPVGSAIFIWINGNRVVLRTITAWDYNETITFDKAIVNNGSAGAGGRFALLNHPDCLTDSGEYLIFDGDITLYPYSDPTVIAPRIASNAKYGVNVTGDYVSVRNMITRASSYAGIRLNGVDEGRLIDNEISDCGAANSHPIFVMGGSTNCQVLQNRVNDSVHGFGIIVTHSSNIYVDDNDVVKCNRTAIYASASTNVEIRGNRIGDRIGVHGNGIATYTNVSGIKVLDNDVIMPGGGICYAHETTAGTIVAGNVFLGSNIPGGAGQLVDIHYDKTGQGGHMICANTWYTRTGDLGKALSIHNNSNVRIGTVVSGNLGDGFGIKPTSGGQTLARFDDNGFISNWGYPHSDADLIALGLIDLKSDRATMFVDAANGDFNLTSGGKAAVTNQVSPGIAVEGVTVTWLGAYDPADNSRPFSGWRASRGYS